MSRWHVPEPNLVPPEPREFLERDEDELYQEYRDRKLEEEHERRTQR